MIGKLTGKLDGLLEGGCIFDVNGVGYLLSCSTKTLDRLRDVQGQAAMLVETQVRQDAIVLVGFATLAERDTFRRLTTIQGVGTKLALDILSAFGPEELAAAVRAADRAASANRRCVAATIPTVSHSTRPDVSTTNSITASPSALARRSESG